MAPPLVFAPRVTAHAERIGSRKPRRNTLIVLHTTEGGEGPTKAEDLASQCTKKGDRPKKDGSGMFGSSYQYVVDTDRVIPIVPEDFVSFSARGANDDGIHIVIPGKAAQSRDEWLDAVTSAYIDQCAVLAIDISRRTGIPLVKLTVEAVQRRASGYIDHKIVSDAFGLTDHSDVGPNFPWDVFAARLTEFGGDDVGGGDGGGGDGGGGAPGDGHGKEMTDDMLPIITNKQALGRVPPNVIKWALMDDGSLRVLDVDEWKARGEQPGVQWDNSQLQLHGVDIDVHR